MPTSSLACPHSKALALPRGHRTRFPRAFVRVAASRGDGESSSNNGDKDEQRSPVASSFAQRAAAGASALLLSLSPPLLLPPPPCWSATTVKYLTRDELSTVELFKRATPSVVFVTALGERRDALTLDVSQTPQGAGSGVVWDTEGHVVTNYHVLASSLDRVKEDIGERGKREGESGGEWDAVRVSIEGDVHKLYRPLLKRLTAA